MEEERIPTGILYREDKPDFHKKHNLLKEGKTLIGQDSDTEALEGLIQRFI
jgi:2-oxoglutarate ferredoxin oxidoreductase subunit beta